MGGGNGHKEERAGLGGRRSGEGITTAWRSWQRSPGVLVHNAEETVGRHAQPVRSAAKTKTDNKPRPLVWKKSRLKRGDDDFLKTRAWSKKGKRQQRGAGRDETACPW